MRWLGSAFEGVVGIGAVNCQDHWNICNYLRIRSYPHLRLFSRAGQSRSTFVPHCLLEAIAHPSQDSLISTEAGETLNLLLNSFYLSLNL